ncbi:mannose-6-phosphate isomerase, class I [Microbacterium sp. Bi121]|uniref:mannose-6-phosphate isomerase, class I n=1 Tax=Microbacterium sp. Bi121 TaxID=2822348 RepID=UPI001D1DCBFD|nr:mannose-6-phosphate isomerase, class I [Microbacterium sp. Bi121]CAH0134153.1 Mannose-6-phosphate isomerase [Microbacterium sp. Bi121]
MLLRLSNIPRDYAWGSPTLLAELERRQPSGSPEAEVWFGDHPGDPADVEDGSTLDAVTGGTLPYLLKLLAAGDPLSIQVHPTIAQARDGWARETHLAADDPTRNYRDENHKPELIVALSDRFEALGGLRPVADTLRLLDSLGPSSAVTALRVRLSADGDALGDAIAWLLSGAAQAEVADIIAALEHAASDEFAPELDAARRIAARNPGDAGVVVALLMNFIVLGRGEGIFLRAGLLHAYVSGLGVEIMAASDNVLRGGLTPKHIDVPELLSILDTTPGTVPVLRPATAGPVTSYPVDVPDFALRRVVLDGAPVSVDVVAPAMVLSAGGEVTVEGADAATVTVPVGQVVFASEGERTLVLSGEGVAFVAEPGATRR